MYQLIHFFLLFIAYLPYSPLEAKLSEDKTFYLVLFTAISRTLRTVINCKKCFLNACKTKTKIEQTKDLLKAPQG